MPIITPRTVIGNHHEAFPLFSPGIFAPILKTPLKALPCEIEPASNVAPWLNNAERRFCDDRKMNSPIHTLQRRNFGRMVRPVLDAFRLLLCEQIRLLLIE